LATPLTAVLSAAASLGVTAPSAIASTIAEAAATRSDAATIIIANKQIAAAREETKKVIAATRAQTEATFKQTEATIRLEELRKTRRPSHFAPCSKRRCVSAPPAESAAVRYERERIDAWIRNRLIAYPLASCLLCRKPIIAGQDWQEASNGDARARFHRACHAEWRAEREASARQALGLAG
jgi:hypothetical protein